MPQPVALRLHLATRSAQKPDLQLNSVFSVPPAHALSFITIHCCGHSRSACVLARPEHYLRPFGTGAVHPPRAHISLWIYDWLGRGGNVFIGTASWKSAWMPTSFNLPKLTAEKTKLKWLQTLTKKLSFSALSSDSANQQLLGLYEIITDCMDDA